MERANKLLHTAYCLLRDTFSAISSKQYAVRRSIRFRLTMWYVLILALVLFVFGGVVYTSQAQGLSAQLHENLRLDAEHLAAVYDPSTGQLTLPDPVKGKMALGADDVVITVDTLDTTGQFVHADGPINSSDLSKLLDTMLTMQKLGIGSIQDAEQAQNLMRKLEDAKKAGQDVSGLVYPVLAATRSNDTFFDFALRGDPAGGGRAKQPYLFYSTPIVMKNTVVGTLILGRPREDEAQMARLLVTLLLATPATLLMTAIGGYWLATRAMRPVRAITRAAREIGEADLSRRLNLESKDELGELAATFDGMLDRLQAAFNRQRQFTADASHELRTPLTIVGLEVDHALTMDDGPLMTSSIVHRPSSATEEYRRALTVIQAENEYMARLVNNLLMLARADAGQVVGKREELDLSDLVLEVVERLEPLARRSGVALHVGALPELKIAGDRLYLGQMLANLVENAIKYSTPGPKSKVQSPKSKVSSSTSSETDFGPGTLDFGHMCNWVRVESGSTFVSGKPCAWVRVEDNGPGIASAHLPHLFDRFYRVDAARSHNEDANGKGEPGGSGLGLSIVQWVAQAHGGNVYVQSAPGAGSTFEVHLPLAP